MYKTKWFVLSVFALGMGLGQLSYQKPPKAILDVLNAPPLPDAVLSPLRGEMLLVESNRNPPISEMAAPVLRLAGVRINPKNNGPHAHLLAVGMKMKRLDGTEVPIVPPPDPRMGLPSWSPDGKYFAFLNATANSIELWAGDSASGKVHKVPGVRINAVFENPFREPFHWLPDSRTLVVQLVPAGRGKEPASTGVPAGPSIQESKGKAAPVRTYEDMLTSPHDEDLFEYYATAQLALVDVASGRVTPAGTPAIFAEVDPAPDGTHILVVKAHRPFSYLHPYYAFPHDVEIWDRGGKLVRKVASLPLADRVPIGGVETGPRSFSWNPAQPATLLWAEAMDGGDPDEKAQFRDRILVLKAPFQGEPSEFIKTQERFAGLEFGEKGNVVLIRDSNRNTRHIRTYLVSQAGNETPRLIWDKNSQDRYHDPGTPVTRTLKNGHRAIRQDGDSIFLSGLGASAKGDRPFLDRFDLQTLKSERLYQCDAKSYETVAGLLADDGSRVLVRRESPTEPPNYFVRTRGDASLKPLTHFPDPAPQLRAIETRLVTYKREDGVPLSFKLYLPPGYKAGTRLPTVVWAYPREFNDSDTAGQVAGSPQRFTTITGMSHLFFLLAGYAVLDEAGMPVVGDPKTVNDTYIEQIVMDARAAIDKAVELGVTDRNRVGVGGHSYGAFMTANLLAHSNLFRAGIARSGAYNRTLTPFGFQSERRTFWQASDIYMKMSPFMFADKLKTPILMIHGEADDNPGTFPIQSERMYQAVRGNGGTARLVMLPHEPHGYRARESIEHVLYEMVSWFDRYVKNPHD